MPGRSDDGRLRESVQVTRLLVKQRIVLVHCTVASQSRWRGNWVVVALWRAVLFAGSVARDQHRPFSDVDLLVVVPDISTLAVRVVVGSWWSGSPTPKPAGPSAWTGRAPSGPTPSAKQYRFSTAAQASASRLRQSTSFGPTSDTLR